MLQHAIAAGELLNRARPMLTGRWLTWLRDVGISQPTAWRYMELARRRDELFSLNNPPETIGAALDVLSGKALARPKPKEKHPMAELWEKWRRVVGTIPPPRYVSGPSPWTTYSVEDEPDPGRRKRRARAMIEEGRLLIERGEEALKTVSVPDEAYLEAAHEISAKTQPGCDACGEPLGPGHVVLGQDLADVWVLRCERCA
jgi:hypothetical protein